MMKATETGQPLGLGCNEGLGCIRGGLKQPYACYGSSLCRLDAASMCASGEVHKQIPSCRMRSFISVFAFFVAVCVPVRVQSLEIVSLEEWSEVFNGETVALVGGMEDVADGLHVGGVAGFYLVNVFGEGFSKQVSSGDEIGSSVFAYSEPVGEIGNANSGKKPKAESLQFLDDWFWAFFPVAACWLAGCFNFDGGRKRLVHMRPNVRAKLATTAWRAGRQAQNGP